MTRRQLSLLLLLGFASVTISSINALIKGYQVPQSLSLVALSILILATVIYNKK